MNRRGMHTIAAVAILLGAATIGAGAPSSLQAQDVGVSGALDADEIKRNADQAISRLRSPYCPGLMLEVCTSSGGGALRDTIRAWAETGVSADSLVERVIAEYGEEYRAFPKTTGKGLLAWLAPPIAFLLGLIVVGLVLRRLRASAPPQAKTVTAEDEARVRAALEELERAEGPIV